jgi:hypothetical protein
MGCCFSVKSVLTASKPPRAGVIQNGGPFQRFGSSGTLDEMPASTGKFTGSTPVGKTTVQSDTSGTEGSPGSDTDAAEFHRFTSYYGNTATEDVSLRILRRGVVKFNVNQKQVRGECVGASRRLLLVVLVVLLLFFWRMRGKLAAVSPQQRCPWHT